MSKEESKGTDEKDLSRGVAYVKDLPDKNFDDLWERIKVAKQIKERLIAQSLLEFNIREHFDFSEIPLHGLILLIGPPGTGKTSMAKGLASQIAHLMKEKEFQYVEVDPHALAATSFGTSQREIRDLIHGTISNLAKKKNLIVLMDEVETLAVDRSKTSLEANPIDVHRGTDAILTGLDALAQMHKNILFIATSNFYQAIDNAFVSRVDLSEYVDRPDIEACESIIEDAFEMMSRQWPELKKLMAHADFRHLALDAHGLDGRQIRKSILQACVLDKEVALDPNKLTFKHLRRAFSQTKVIEGNVKYQASA